MRADHESAWYHATTLAERLDARTPFDVEAGGDERSSFRLHTWKSQRPFNQAAFFEQRLALDHLNESDLRWLLAEPAHVIRQRIAPPQWLRGLRSALSSRRTRRSGGLRDLLAARWRSNPDLRFLAVAEPIIDQALARLEEGAVRLARRTSCDLFDPTTVSRMFLRALTDTLLTMVTRTLVLEMHIARMEGHLEGATAAARFDSFVERLRTRRHAQALLRGYPVLARCMQEASDRWFETTVELLERLALDEAALEAAFGGGTGLGTLTTASGGLSDPRHGGRSVSILQFSSGTRIVYKPKSLAIDLHFQQLVEWLNVRGARPSLRTLAVLDRGSYGWAEYARPRHCRSAEEVERFYARQGAFLALLYVLEATDFHAGNIIASGEHPVLIDLEAFFFPRRTQPRALPVDADRIARDGLSRSVLRVGLLPERVFTSDDDEAVDMSGLGTLDGQLTPHGVPHWEAPGTDAMHLVRKRKSIRPDDNRPTLDGAAVDVLDYRTCIADGFRHTYSLLLAHRDELLADDGPLARFAGDQTCVFLRSMRTYRRLLKESYHPDLLRDALDRERHFDLLWVEVESHPELAKLIPSERADLLRGDIPVMITRPDSRDLWTSAGHIPGFFDEAGLSAARARVHGLSEQDLARQSWLIEASLATLCEHGPDRSPYPVTTPVSSSDAHTFRNRLMAAAAAQGERLCELAVRGDSSASWIGLQSVRDRFWSVEALDVDLGEGLPGVAVFLAYLGAATGRAKYSALAEATVTTLQRQIDEARDGIVRVGAFDGWGGIVYTLTHLGRLWKRPDLIEAAEGAAARIPGLIEQDDNFDVCNGAAGCVLVLRQVSRAAGSDGFIDIARRCGDHLLANAVTSAAGVGWRAGSAPTRPLAGLAHGAAGVAWALMELADWTGEARYRAAALDALRYERSLFLEAEGNWPHLVERRIAGSVDREEIPLITTSWCHGAPGVALARLRSLTLSQDPDVLSEVATALHTTVRDGFGRNHSLGHGDLGCLDVLLHATLTLADPAWSVELERLTAAVLTSIEEVGPRSAAPFNVETPGLLTGLAGIGAGLLRLADPSAMPSLLALDPPPRSSHG